MPIAHIAGILLLLGAASLTHISRRAHKLAADLIIWLGYLFCVAAAMVLLGRESGRHAQTKALPPPRSSPVHQTDKSPACGNEVRSIESADWARATVLLLRQPSRFWIGSKRRLQ